MNHVDGDGPGAARARPLGERSGNLQEALGPDEVVAEVRTQRIAVPGGAGNFATSLTQERVVQEGDERALRR
ncbi:hypothetical protein D3C78_1378810 [compost metagenome]